MFSSWTASSSSPNAALSVGWASTLVQRVSTAIDEAESHIDRFVGVAAVDAAAASPAPLTEPQPSEAASIAISVSPPETIEPPVPSPQPQESQEAAGAPTAAYEAQLKLKSEQIAALMEENEWLRHAAAQADVDTLTREFTERISQLERKYQTVLKDRDALKKKLTAGMATDPSQSNSANSGAETALLVAQLRAEGEQLQARIIKYEATIKKLRTEKQESEQERVALTQQLSELRERLDAAEKQVHLLTDREKKRETTLDGMRNLSEATRSEMEELRDRARDATERAALFDQQQQAAWLQVGLLKKELKETDEKWRKELADTEFRVRDELAQSYRVKISDAFHRETHLQSVITDLRTTLDSTIRSNQSKEEDYETRIASLTLVLQEQEHRLSTAATATTQSTKPLLRQIAELQLQLQSRDETISNLERNLRSRLTDEENRSASLQGDINRLVEQLETTQQQLVLSKLSVNASEIRANQLEQELHKALTSVQSSSRRLIESEARLLILDSNLAAAQTARIESESQAAALKSQLVTAEKTVEELTLLNDRLMQNRHHQPPVPVPSTVAPKHQSSTSVWVEEYDDINPKGQRLFEADKEKAELEQRYLAALELLGEQAEKLHEMENDIVEIKQVYKRQIEELVNKMGK